MKRYEFAEIGVMSMPTVCDVRNKYIFGGVRHVVNVSGQRYSKDIQYALNERGILTYEFPLVETGPDMGMENILGAISVIGKADAAGEKVIVHCVGGNNRSRAVVEAYHYAKTGTHYPDEYKGAFNHLLYNSAEGHLPPAEELERILRAANL